MQKFTVKYLPGLGSYLDDNNIEWFDNSDDTVTITCQGINHLFDIAYRVGFLLHLDMTINSDYDNHD